MYSVIQSVHVMLHTFMHQWQNCMAVLMILVFYTSGTCGLQINLLCYVLAHVDQYDRNYLTFTEGCYGYKSFFTIDDALIVPLKMAPLQGSLPRNMT